ncbi:hypothetical protein YIM_07145 [Amycolatopsis sp. YIM 10]|nr:hypothetical protein YIM_07145 [Amycolatopsis sp. YIM 10]
MCSTSASASSRSLMLKSWLARRSTAQASSTFAAPQHHDRAFGLLDDRPRGQRVQYLLHVVGVAIGDGRDGDRADDQPFVSGQHCECAVVGRAVEVLLGQLRAHRVQGQVRPARISSQGGRGHRLLPGGGQQRWPQRCPVVIGGSTAPTPVAASTCNRPPPRFGDGWATLIAVPSSPGRSRRKPDSTLSSNAVNGVSTPFPGWMKPSDPLNRAEPHDPSASPELTDSMTTSTPSLPQERTSPLKTLVAGLGSVLSDLAPL